MSSTKVPKLTCTLISSLRNENRIFVLSPSIDMIDEVSSIVRIVDSFPTVWQLVVATIFGPSLLNSRHSRVEPVRRSAAVIYEVDFALLGVSLFPVGGKGTQGVEAFHSHVVWRVWMSRIGSVRSRTSRFTRRFWAVA
jgi:hypothetical protein